MNATKFVTSSVRQWLVNGLLPFAAMILVLTISSVARSDMRKAARQAVAATVAVEWETPAAPEKVDYPEAREKVDYSEYGSVYSPPPKTPGPQPYRLTPPKDHAPGSTSPVPASIGRASATVVSPDGLLVTRLDAPHGEELKVTFSDGRTLVAKLLVYDHRTGLQLLRVDAEKLPHLEVAEDDVELGQPVLVAACTGLRSREVAQGIVAATGCSLPDVPCDTVQTDALVGPMSAGGPLVDVDGRLVGIVVAKVGQNARQRGPAFAIPARWVTALLDASKEEETRVIQRGLLGIVLDASSSDKPVVKKIMEDQPAGKAGICVGDEIVAVGGSPVSEPDDVVREIGRCQAGDRVKITVRRDGQQQEFEVTLSARKAPVRTAQTGPSTRIEYVHPEGLLFSDKDGDLRVITPGPGYSYGNTKQNAEALKAWQEAAKAWQEDAGSGQDRAKLYQQALKAYQELLRSRQPTTPTIRVERSDVEKSLGELNGEIRSLKEQIKDLNEAVKKLNQRLSENDGSE
jgi:S1-C subfamily serine protease